MFGLNRKSALAQLNHCKTVLEIFDFLHQRNLKHPNSASAKTINDIKHICSDTTFNRGCNARKISGLTAQVRKSIKKRWQQYFENATVLYLKRLYLRYQADSDEEIKLLEGILSSTSIINIFDALQRQYPNDALTAKNKTLQTINDIANCEDLDALNIVIPVTPEIAKCIKAEYSKNSWFKRMPRIPSQQQQDDSSSSAAGSKPMPWLKNR